MIHLDSLSFSTTDLKEDAKERLISRGWRFARDSAGNNLGHALVKEVKEAKLTFMEDDFKGRRVGQVFVFRKTASAFDRKELLEVLDELGFQ